MYEEFSITTDRRIIHRVDRSKFYSEGIGSLEHYKEAYENNTETVVNAILQRMVV